MPGSIPLAEFEIGRDLVQDLLQQQIPRLAQLPIRFEASGWDNAIFRVGNKFATRMPRRKLAARLIKHEQRWLPMFTESLPLATPELIYAGRAALGFPWPWIVVRWIPGTPIAELTGGFDRQQLLVDLAQLLNAIHIPAIAAAPKNASRGVPLAMRDELTRNYANQIERIDRTTVLKLWAESIGLPVWKGVPMWLHGDLHPLNLLINEGRLSGVIDFGDVTAGDPAADFAVAWMIFDEAERIELKALLRVNNEPIDQATWERARGWALSISLALMANSNDSPVHRQLGERTLQRVLR